jgi:hypothetical protein
MGYNRCPLFTILTEQKFCLVSFVKINKTGILKLDQSENPLGDSFVSKLTGYI